MTDLDFHHDSFDLAIISTTADVRARVTAQLFSKHKVKYLILEKLITGSTSDLKELDSVLAGHNSVWVNYPRRLSSLYKGVNENLKLKDNLLIKVSGEEWNLVSNIPHFIDLIEFLTKAKLEKVNFSLLAPTWKETRPNFHDTTGSVECLFSNGIEAHFNSAEKGSLSCNGIKISIESEKLSGTIFEENGMASGSIFHQNVSGDVDFQSTLSGILAHQILLDKKCLLTSYLAARISHQIYISALEYHLNENDNKVRVRFT
jgi:hypothetical protein